MKWLRLYTEVLHDPKVQRLHPSLFKAWINLLCIANRDRDRGSLPPVEDIAFALRVKPAEAEKVILQLEEKGLLDRANDGTLRPHNWSERQRNSDVGATRQQRYREKKKRENNILGKEVTSPSRYGDALEVDKDKKNTYIGFFESLWKDYPAKDGKKEAARHFKATVKSEDDCARIRKALDNYLVMLQQEKADGFNRRPKNGNTWFNNWQDWENWKPTAGQETMKPEAAPSYMTDPAFSEELL